MCVCDREREGDDTHFILFVEFTGFNMYIAIAYEIQ